MAFTGVRRTNAQDTCSICHEPRFISERQPLKARSQFAYIPLASRLQLQWNQPQRAKILKEYRQQLQHTYQHGIVRDVFDGNLFRDYHQQTLRLFQDPRDIALSMSLDGVQLTNRKTHEVWPIILTNLNLPPDCRVKAENILASMLIPGPRSPKELDSYLYPLVEEMELLGSHGVPAFDSHSNERFTMRAWIVLVTGILLYSLITPDLHASLFFIWPIITNSVFI